MGTILIIAAFFVALLASGQVLAETDFGTKATEFFTPSTYLMIFAFLLWRVGEILEKRKEEKSDMD